MKRQILLLISIILLGVVAIILPNFLSSYSDNKQEEELKALELQHNKLMAEISSTPDTIEKPEVSPSELEPGLYDEKQMYFEDIEKLYDYLLFAQVEDIKQKVQFYVQQYIGKEVLDCKLQEDSIKQEGNIIYFSLDIKDEDVKEFQVKVTKNNEGGITDITIMHDYK